MWIKAKSFQNKLQIGKKKINGRNNSGKITVYHRGGGNKKNYRLIDFQKYIWNTRGIIINFEYEPRRNTPINTIFYSQGIVCYCIHIHGTFIGDTIINKNQKILTLGCGSYLKNFNLNSYICQITYFYINTNQYIRSMGTFGVITNKTKKKIFVKLSSKKIKTFNMWNTCILGRISMLITQNNYKKAGYSRNRGWRPIVRGVAMNPVDHPHGGGEGKTSGGRPSVTPWGKITKGLKTKKKWKKS